MEHNNIKYLQAALQTLTEQSYLITNDKWCNSVESLKYRLLLAETLDMTSQCDLSDDLSVMDYIREVTDIRQVTDSVEASDVIEKKSFHYFQEVAKLAFGENNITLKMQYKALMSLAEFCDHHLKKAEENDSTQPYQPSDKSLEYADSLSRSVLTAMRVHAGEFTSSILKFPRLLQTNELYGSRIISSFIQHCQHVPSWMFLGWVGHLVALLDSNIATSIHPIMQRLADDYPQAVVYPVKAASDGFSYSNDEAGREKLRFVQKLQKELDAEIPVLNRFVTELTHVNDVSIYFKDWATDYGNLLQEKASEGKLKECYSNMYNMLFGHLYKKQEVEDDEALYGSQPKTHEQVGRARKLFAKCWKSKVDELFGGPSGSKIKTLIGPRVGSKARDHWHKSVKKLQGEVAIKKGDIQARQLKDYSPWLAEFDAIQYGHDNLEIPGQYDGRSRPMPEYHVKIASFDSRIDLMASLRRPCRVVIRGSDEKDHQFLIKGGEDLRQDQRIEQIFVAINDILREDPDCRRKNYSIMTYQVIPVSSKVGMIEWVKSVQPMMDFITDQARRMNCNDAITNMIVDCNKNWLPHGIVDYNDYAKRGTYTQVVERFNEKQQRIPPDILRQAYIRLSADIESFLTLRKTFSSSYGVMCVTNWILGIGDRHPSNILISTSTAKALGIDFGHAFGSATEWLPIPELVPFRLTRQIRELLSPHSTSQGELRQVMVRCLSTLRSKAGSLLPILDVFVHDPSVDWCKFAKKTRSIDKKVKQAGGGGDEKGGNDRLWYARRKMNIVKWKLEGGSY